MRDKSKKTKTAEKSPTNHDILQEIDNLLNKHPDTECKTDVIRELMLQCDILMKSYQSQHGTLSPALKKLDEKLWEWFSQPTQPAEFRENVKSLLEEIDEYPLPENNSSDQTGSNKESPLTNDLSDVPNSTQVSVPTTGSVSGLCLKVVPEKEIIEDFLKEANIQINDIERLLIKIEESPGKDNLNQLFRCMHTVNDHRLKTVACISD